MRRREIKIPDLLQTCPCLDDCFPQYCSLRLPSLSAIHMLADVQKLLHLHPQQQRSKSVPCFWQRAPKSALYACCLPLLPPPPPRQSQKSSLWSASASSYHQLQTQSGSAEESCFKEKNSEEKKIFLNKKIKKPNRTFSDDNLYYVAKCRWGWEWE